MSGASGMPMPTGGRPGSWPPAGPRPASGDQFLLRRGEATARIGQVAAVLREFSVDGVHYTETWPDQAVPPMGCGIVLAPWPNRIAGGRWTHDGRPLQLDVTEPDNGNAIHGLLRNTAYQLIRQAVDSVTLGASVYPQHGWPFTLDTSVTYTLTDDGLAVRHEVSNVGSSPAPFGCGAHPYLRVGGVSVPELTLTVRARTRAVTDDKLIPIDLEPVAGTAAELSRGVRLSGLRLDGAFTDLEPVGDRFEHTLTAPDGRGVTLWTDPAFRWVQVYTPPNFPVPDGPRPAVAVEPMTCGANAFNTGRDVITLQPGESWSGSWGLTPVS
jgi:aldose 1-epimerase